MADSETGKPEVLMDPEKAKPVGWEDFPDSVKRQACLYYISGHYPDDEAIGRAVGAPALLIARWRAEGEPGGSDWHQLRKMRESGEWYIAPASTRFDAAQSAEGIMQMGALLLDICDQALRMNTLVNDLGEPVEYLWEAETGKKVPINALSRPKDLKEIATVISLLLRIEGMRDTAEERRMMQARFLSDMQTAFGELVQAIGITEAQQDAFRDAVQRLQNQGRLPEGTMLEVQFKGGRVK